MNFFLKKKPQFLNNYSLWVIIFALHDYKRIIHKIILICTSQKRTIRKSVSTRSNQKKNKKNPSEPSEIPKVQNEMSKKKRKSVRTSIPYKSNSNPSSNLNFEFEFNSQI